MSVKDINIRNHTYNVFGDIINMKEFNPNNTKIDKKSYKSYKSYKSSWAYQKIPKIYSANPLYLIFYKVNIYFEKISKNQYLMLVPTNESNKKIKRYGEM